MRKLSLPDSADGRSVWSILWVSTQSFPVGDKAQTLTLSRLRRAIKKSASATAIKGPDGKEIEPRQESLRLKEGGADLILEEAEMGLLVKALDEFRKKLVGDSVEPLALLDELIEKAPEISSEDLLPKAKAVVETIETIALIDKMAEKTP